MPFTLSSAKLTATPDAYSWTQVYEFKPDDAEKLKLRGHLFAIASTKKINTEDQAGQENIVNLGREIITRLQEEYFGNLEAPAFKALKAAVSKVISEFNEEFEKLEIAAVANLGEIAYSTAGGGAQIMIARGGALAKILDSEKESLSAARLPAGQGRQVVSASGYPKVNDIFILGTSSFFNIFPIEELKKGIYGKKINFFAETLAPRLHTEKKGNLGAVFVNFEELVQKNILPFTADDSNRTTAEKQRIETQIGEQQGFFTKKYRAITTSLGNSLDRKLENLPQKKIYVREGDDEEKIKQKRRVAASIGAILLTLLFISVLFGIRQKNRKEAKGL